MSDAAASSLLVKTPLPSLPEVVENIGCGPTHVRYCMTGGGVYVADGSELLLISAITESLSSGWHLSPLQRGGVVTIVYVGLLVGNLLCGPLGDKYGRKICILLSYIVVFVASWVSSYAQGYATLCQARFIVGIGIGLGVPSFNALGAEITPRRWRMAFQASSGFLFTLGEVYCAILIMADDPTMQDLTWRPLVRKAALPGLLFFILSLIFLYESPSYLAVTGRKEEGHKILSSNARDNGCPDMDVDFQPVKASAENSDKQVLGSQLFVVFNRHFLVTTLVCSYTTIVCNLVCYGSLYAFPQVLPGMIEDNKTSAGAQLLFGALWEIPGNFLGMIVGTYLRRKLVLKLSLAVLSISAALFVLGTTASEEGPLASAAWHTGYYGLKCFVVVLFSAAYVFSSEVYPTSVRTTGSAWCCGLGRLGSMSSPLIYEYMEAGTGSHACFFWFMFVLVTFNALIIDFVPFEPTLQAVSDTVDDDEEELDKLAPDEQASSYGGSKST